VGLLVPALAGDAARDARTGEQALDLDLAAAVDAAPVGALVEAQRRGVELLQLRQVAIGVGRLDRVVAVGGVGFQLLDERVAALADGGAEFNELSAGEGPGFFS
jgi:hypothetical protein